jgi:aminoglycoside/choline kinase family phosphotransferase
MKPDDIEKIYSTVAKSSLPVKIFTLAGDASTRRYFRVQTNSQTMIMCLDNNADNFDKFLFWNQFYRKHNIDVPTVIAHNREQTVILLEDLGDRHFINYVGEAAEGQREKFLKMAIDNIINILKFNIQPSAIPFPILSFNPVKLSYEFDHTEKYFLEKYLSVRLDLAGDIKKYYQKIHETLVDQKQYFCHRDYHSRNILIKNERLVLIDFQDTMYGSALYDLVSLLDDAYFDYSPELRDRCKAYFVKNVREQLGLFNDINEFNYLYEVQKIQRLYKAIGSFTYLFSERNGARYLKYVSQCFERVRQSCEKYDDLKPLGVALSKAYYGH